MAAYEKIYPGRPEKISTRQSNKLWFGIHDFIVPGADRDWLCIPVSTAVYVRDEHEDTYRLAKPHGAVGADTILPGQLHQGISCLKLPNYIGIINHDQFHPVNHPNYRLFSDRLWIGAL
jgi:hypothetical protein